MPPCSPAHVSLVHRAGQRTAQAAVTSTGAMGRPWGPGGRSGPSGTAASAGYLLRKLPPWAPFPVTPEPSSCFAGTTAFGYCAHGAGLGARRLRRREAASQARAEGAGSEEVSLLWYQETGGPAVGACGTQVAQVAQPRRAARLQVPRAGQARSVSTSPKPGPSSPQSRLLIAARCRQFPRQKREGAEGVEMPRLRLRVV